MGLCRTAVPQGRGLKTALTKHRRLKAVGRLDMGFGGSLGAETMIGAQRAEGCEFRGRRPVSDYDGIGCATGAVAIAPMPFVTSSFW